MKKVFTKTFLVLSLAITLKLLWEDSWATLYELMGIFYMSKWIMVAFGWLTLAVLVSIKPRTAINVILVGAAGYSLYLLGTDLIYDFRALTLTMALMYSLNVAWAGVLAISFYRLLRLVHFRTPKTA